MYDTIHFRLMRHDVEGAMYDEALNHIASLLTKHSYQQGQNIDIHEGYIDGLYIRATPYYVEVKNSLCKWHLGNNLETLSRQSTERAIEKLSALLHLPMGQATITRVDVARNMTTTHPPECYLTHLGNYSPATRGPYSADRGKPTGLIYKFKDRELVFYDKTKEAREKRATIPDLYKGRNVLRYELRYMRRVPKQLGRDEVRAWMLYDEDFYINLNDRWRDEYKNIEKINTNRPSVAIKRVRDLNREGIVALGKQYGGELGLLEHFSQQRRAGVLTPKEYFDLKKAIKEAHSVEGGIMEASPLIDELNEKIKTQIAFYR